jgi:diguanylate cyclase (GGDEF)-like protein
VEYDTNGQANTAMLKRFLGQFLIDLGELEADYRAFHLKDDIAHSTLYMVIAILSILGMFRMDLLLYQDRPILVFWLIVYRVSYIFVTVLALIATRKTSSVRTYDRLIFGWVCLTIIFLLFLNFTRPASLLNTAFDVIVPFALYIFLPFKILYSIALALGYTVGTLFIDHFYKTGMDVLNWNMIITAQLIVHALGFVSGLQIQSYRRKSFQAYMQEKDTKEMVAYLANIDPLTKSLTRRQFFSIAESEFQRYLRYRRQFSMLVVDADHFKNVNDTYGHHAGDLVLRSLSLVILEQKRAQDTFGRLGGEEFGLLLPETNLEQAKVVAERIQKICEQTPTKVDEHVVTCTVSIGVTGVGSSDKTFEDVLRRADRMMYKAKEAGRNTVVAE